MYIMNKYLFFLYLFILLVTFGCNTEKGENNKNTHRLKGSEINITGSDEIGYPTRLLPVNDSLLFILDYYYRTHLSLINIKQGKHVKHLCKKGPGPREVVHPTSVWMEEDILGIYDSGSQAIKKYLFYKDSLIFKNSFSLKKKNHPIYKALGINDSIYICSGFFFPERYFYYNSNQNSFKPFGKYPFYEELRIPPETFPLTFQSKFCYFGNQYLVSYVRTSPSISFYKIRNHSVTLLKEHNYEVPEVIPHTEKKGQWLERKQTNKYGFLSVESYKGNIFALYSGRSYSEFKNSVYCANTIIIYDREGNEKTRLSLNVDINQFCIMGNEIIGAKASPEIKFFRFPISKDI